MGLSQFGTPGPKGETLSECAARAVPVRSGPARIMRIPNPAVARR